MTQKIGARTSGLRKLMGKEIETGDRSPDVTQPNKSMIRCKILRLIISIQKE